MNKGKSFLMYSGLALTMLFWALSFIWYKQVFEFIGPVSTIFLRLVISSLLLWPIGFAIKRIRLIKKEHLKWFFLAAFFEPFMYFVGESYGVKYVSSTLSSLIISTIPVFTAVMGVYLLKERLNSLNIAGIIISLFGVALVIISNGESAEYSLKGVFLLMVAVVSAVFYSVIVKRLTQNYNPYTIVTVQNTIGIFYFLPLVLLLEFNDLRTVSLSKELLIPLLELSVFASTLAFIFFTNAVRTIGVSKANVFANFIPVFTAVAAYFMINESLTLLKITGIVLAIGGVFLSQVKRKRKRIHNLY
jgi:drug/metabolite transporter (DMT)-like permease